MCIRDSRIPARELRNDAQPTGAEDAPENGALDIEVQHQADELDEQADARGDAVFQVLGDAVDQRLTELERGKNDEDNAFH